jgi:hypothetical protein
VERRANEIPELDAQAFQEWDPFWVPGRMPDHQHEYLRELGQKKHGASFRKQINRGQISPRETGARTERQTFPIKIPPIKKSKPCLEPKP